MLEPVLDSDKSAAPDKREHSERPAWARALRWLPSGVLIAATLAAIAYALPKANRHPLVETTVWSLLVVTCFAGWGSLVRMLVARSERIDLGLRVAWGAAATCFVGGVLMAAGSMGRTMALVIVDIGLVLAIGSLVRERDGVRGSLAFIGRVARREPRLATLAVAVFGLLVLHYLAGVADWHTNPYDDDIAYLAFVKKLLDTGTVIEPFSLRRLSALGGQTFFIELVSLRAAPSQGHTFDRSISMLMVVLLIVGHRRQGRRLPLLASLTTVLVLLTLPNATINTASYLSGVAFFLALFRTAVWADQGAETRGALRTAVPLALVGAAVCTLRQNYMAAATLFLGASYTFRFTQGGFGWTSTWIHRLREPLVAAALSMLALVPWFVVGWQSNRTFAYPVLLGTSNPATLLVSDTSTFLHELSLFVRIFLEGTPLHFVPLFILAAVVIRESDRRKPVWSLAIAVVGGVAMLVHGLSQSDAGNLGRYAFGVIIAFALAVVMTIATTPWSGTSPSSRRRTQLAAGLTMLALLLTLFDVRIPRASAYAKDVANIETLWRQGPRSKLSDGPQSFAYRGLQNAVPPGQRMAVMLDEPYWLDFARNPIWNLDMPGYSSLAPGLPYFQGPELVEQYFKGLGVRYVAFVRPEFSRYHYRREYWLEMIVSEQELWRIHAPYLIDLSDNLAALERAHGNVFDSMGMVVVDLEKVR